MTGPLTVYRGTETLRRGWTTGSCAAAASQAAAILLLTGAHRRKSGCSRRAA